DKDHADAEVDDVRLDAMREPPHERQPKVAKRPHRRALELSSVRSRLSWSSSLALVRAMSRSWSVLDSAVVASRSMASVACWRSCDTPWNLSSRRASFSTAL